MTAPISPTRHYSLHRQVQGRRAALRLYDAGGQLAACAQHLLGRLHDDIAVWADEARSQALLKLQANARPGIYPSYALFDPHQPERALVWFQRQPWRHLPYDVWQVDGADGRPLGYLYEAGIWQAGLRLLFWGGWIPRRCVLSPHLPGARAAGRRPAAPPLARYHQDWNIFRYRLVVDISNDPAGGWDRRIGMAAAFLLAIGEGFYEYRPFQKPHFAESPPKGAT